MGNNTGWSNWEATVFALHKHKVLTAPILKDVSEVFSGQDLDAGGSSGELTEEGWDIGELVVRIMKPGYVPEPDEDYPEHGPDWYGAFSEIQDEWQW